VSSSPPAARSPSGYVASGADTPCNAFPPLQRMQRKGASPPAPPPPPPPRSPRPRPGPRRRVGPGPRAWGEEAGPSGYRTRAGVLPFCGGGREGEAIPLSLSDLYAASILLSGTASTRSSPGVSWCLAAGWGRALGRRADLHLGPRYGQLRIHMDESAQMQNIFLRLACVSICLKFL